MFVLFLFSVEYTQILLSFYFIRFVSNNSFAHLDNAVQFQFAKPLKLFLFARGLWVNSNFLVLLQKVD